MDYVGPEQVVLGSDYPFDMADARPLRDACARAGSTPAQEEAILGGNAARLLDGTAHREELIG